MRKLAVLAAILAATTAWAASKDDKKDTSASKSANGSATTSSRPSATAGGGTGSAQAGANDVNAPAGKAEHDALSKDDFSLKGKVGRVSARSVTIERDGSTPATLMIEPATKIEVDGKKAQASEIKPGDDVKAAFNLRGEHPIAVDLKASSKSK